MSSNWIRPGDYLMRIEAMKLTTNLKNECLLVIELTCLHVFSDAAAHQIGANPHVPGEKLAASYKQSSLSFDGNVKAMIAGLEGIPGDQIDAALAQGNTSITQHAAHMTSNDQPYAGMIVHVSAMQILTRQQNPFTKVEWRREVRPSELQGILPPQELQRLFPGDTLQRLLETEQKVHGGQAPAQPAPQPQAPAPQPQQPYAQPPAPQQPQYAPQQYQQPQAPQQAFPTPGQLSPH